MPKIIKHKIFQQINCIRFGNIVNNTPLIKTFNSDNSNIASIKTQGQQVMTTITNWLKV